MEKEEEISSSSTKHVLDSNRLQNMTILSEAINLTAEQACNALINGTGLSLQQLEALVRIAPTKQEEAELLEYKGDINELDSAEKFIKVLIVSVPFAFQRAETMLYRETFEDKVVHFKNSASTIEEGCEQLRSSRVFVRIFEVVLRTVTRMNDGTRRVGFQLPDALPKLSDVKYIDVRTTLVHFIIHQITRSEDMGLDLVSGLSSELNHVRNTASLDLDVLCSSISNFSDGMMKLNELVNHEKLEKNGRFVSEMKRFIEDGERKLEELKGDKERVLLKVREIKRYFYAGDLSEEELRAGNADLLRLFVTVRDFLRTLDHVCMELRSNTVQLPL